jgi:hypothetical protein
MLKIKNVLFLFLLGLSAMQIITYSAVSQTTFNYDDSGNRKSCWVFLMKIGVDQGSNDSITSINDYNIKVYPNPTDRLLNVAIDRIKSNTNAKASICDLKGNVLKNIEKLNSENQIDMTAFTNGVYILSIEIEGKKADWKVIKKE